MYTHMHIHMYIYIYIYIHTYIHTPEARRPRRGARLCRAASDRSAPLLWVGSLVSVGLLSERWHKRNT